MSVNTRPQTRFRADIIFHGVDLTLENVNISEIGASAGQMFVHLQKNKRDEFELIHTSSPILLNLRDKGHVVLEFDRSVPETPMLKYPGDDMVILAIVKAAKIHVDKPFMFLDQLEEEFGYRLNWSSGLFDETKDITSIELRKR